MSERFHRQLAASHPKRLNPSLEDLHDERAWYLQQEQELLARQMERRFIEHERRSVAEEVAAAPTGADAFVAWFERLKRTGPGQNDALFPWLAERATMPEMLWFLEQEIAGEAGFEDLLAVAQLKLPNRSKLELARNYWDEMGQGHEGGMHGPMLSKLRDDLELYPTDPVWEALALGNLMVGFAMSRQYAYQAIGALGVIELTAPGRAELVNAGMKRLGIGGGTRRYFALHATLDVKHSDAWNAEVIRPLVAMEPRIAPRLAEGALLRLRAGARCFGRYRAELWGADTESAGHVTS